MSRITFSGNVSGTGTFTVASPNSNADRTLTLPDAAGSLLVAESGTYTPIVTSGSGTITSYTSSGNYVKIGSLVHVVASVNITNNGTGATSISMSLPFAAGPTGFSIGQGREFAVTGNMLQCGVLGSTSTMTVFTYNNQYPGGTNYNLLLNVTYTV